MFSVCEVGEALTIEDRKCMDNLIRGLCLILKWCFALTVIVGSVWLIGGLLYGAWLILARSVPVIVFVLLIVGGVIGVAWTVGAIVNSKK